MTACSVGALAVAQNEETPTHLFSLWGQKAVVTGASGGIGQAIAHILARAGASVVITGTRQGVLENLADEIKLAYPQAGSVHVLASSLHNASEVANLIPQADELTGGIDILINNAGITRDQLAMRMTDEAWDEVIAVNLTSTFKLCRAAVKSMSGRRYGRIVNVASIVGVTGNFGQTNYCASKAGMIGMTKALALETITRNITVNALAPGFIATPMTAGIPEAAQEKILARIPAQKMGRPEDIAAAALFLVSKEAGYITGHTLHVNGGMVMV